MINAQIASFEQFEVIFRPVKDPLMTFCRLFQTTW